MASFFSSESTRASLDFWVGNKANERYGASIERFPRRPLVPPVAAIRASASCWVLYHTKCCVYMLVRDENIPVSMVVSVSTTVQHLVPRLFTATRTHGLEAAHCANWSCMHASSPAVQDELGDSFETSGSALAHLRRSAFCTVNAARSC